MKLTDGIAPIALIAAVASGYVAWEARQDAAAAQKAADKANRLWTQKPDWGMDLTVRLATVISAANEAARVDRAANAATPQQLSSERMLADALRDLKNQQARDASRARILELDRQIAENRAAR